MMGKEDGAVLEWVKNHPWYLQIIPTSEENPGWEIGFASAFEREMSRLRRCQSLRAGNPYGRAQSSSGENPIVD